MFFTPPQPIVAPMPPTALAPSRRWRPPPGLWHWALRAVGLGVAIWLAVLGLQLRAWTFEISQPIRFRHDIQNGWHQGTRVLDRTGVKHEPGKRIPFPAVWKAWVTHYDAIYKSETRGRYSLDYTPLRLLLMTMWVRECKALDPAQGQWTESSTAPLLAVNSIAGGLSAIAVGLLVRHWLRRGRGREPPPWSTRAGRFLWRHRPWAVGLSAAALLWFNAAVIVDGYGFLQWDIWCMPFFLWACWLASVGDERRWGWPWAIAGALVVIGAMFKGQVLMTAPVLLIWPLLLGRWRAVAHMVVGVAVGIAACTWPWLVRSPDAVAWIAGGVAAVAAGAVAMALAGRRRVLRLAIAAVLMGALVWPAPMAAHWVWAAVVLALAVIAAAALWASPWRNLGVVAAGVIGAGVVLAGFRFGGSWSWYQIGFVFPTDHYRALGLGPASNFAAILQNRYRWNIDSPMVTLPWDDTPHTFQWGLRIIYFAALIACGAALAWQSRRRGAEGASRGHPFALAAMVAPWIFMYAIVPQMHERYLMWGASATAVAVGLNSGWLLAHLATTLIAFSQIFHQMLNVNRGYSDSNPELKPWLILIDGTHPDIGWAVLLLGLMWLCAAWGGASRRPAHAGVTPAGVTPPRALP